MQVNRILDVQNGDALQTLRTFLSDWWEQYQLDALLAPVELPDQSTVVVQVIEDPADLRRVNPFAPLMLSNSASQAYQLLQERPDAHLAAMLRPCELRAYNELRKREHPPRGQAGMVVFGVDCLGTYPADAFHRAAQSRGLESLTSEILDSASSGGVQTLQMRTACQVCDWPAPYGADIAIGTIGVDTGEHILVLVRDEEYDRALGLDRLADHMATEYQVSHRETVVGTIADAHAGMRRTMMANIPGHLRFDDIGALLAWLSSCSLCGNCLKACPLYQGELDSFSGLAPAEPSRHTALSDLIQISRWMATCSGCGMCEEKCNRDVPLTLFISSLSHRIREEAHYTAGNPSQPAPWAGN